MKYILENGMDEEIRAVLGSILKNLYINEVNFAIISFTLVINWYFNFVTNNRQIHASAKMSYSIGISSLNKASI